MATGVAGAAALSPLVGIMPVNTPAPTRLTSVTDTAAMLTSGFIFAVSDMSFLHFQVDIDAGIFVPRLCSN
jgi:hypothetical protein